MAENWKIERRNSFNVFVFVFSQIETSISLPCTLRRCKRSQSLRRDSNNCHAWALNSQQFSKKAEQLEAIGVVRTHADISSDNETNEIDGCDGDDISADENLGSDRLHPKEDGDSEYLLSNEHSIRIDGCSSMEKYESCVRSRRNSRVNEQQCPNTAGAKGNWGWIGNEHTNLIETILQYLYYLELPICYSIMLASIMWMMRKII